MERPQEQGAAPRARKRTGPGPDAAAPSPTLDQPAPPPVQPPGRMEPVVEPLSHPGLLDVHFNAYQQLYAPLLQQQKAAVIKFLGLAPDSKPERRLVSEDTNPQSPMNVVRARLEALGVQAQIVAMKADSAKATRLLLALLPRLGRPPAEQTGAMGGCATIREAAQQFGDLLIGAPPEAQGAPVRDRFQAGYTPSAACFTCYGWDRTLNRTTLLAHGGLIWPEAMHGITWRNELSRRVLFDDGDPVSEVTAEAMQPGSFHWRERIARIYALRFRWGSSRIVVFLNYRLEFTPAYALEDLRLAARYFLGWLARSGVQVSAGLPMSGWDARKAFDMLAHAQDREALASRMAELARAGVGGVVRAKVHWTEPAEWGLEPIAIHLRRHDVPPQLLSLTLDPNTRCVAKGLAALSAALGTPVLVTGPESSDLVRALNVAPEVGFEAGSQMAVPVKDSRRQVRAVVTVAACDQQAIDAGRLYWVESVAQLMARMLEIRDNEWRGVVHRKLIEISTAPSPSAQEFLNWFCRTILERVKADLSYVLIFDADCNVFRPRGAAISRDLEHAYVTRRYKGVKVQSQEAFHRLVEDAVRRRLIPHKLGRSREAFEGATEVVCWPVSEEKARPPSEFTREYFSAILALPLGFQAGAQPDGVVWLRWMSDPPRELWSGESWPEKRNALCETVKAKVGPLIEVAATVHWMLKASGAAVDD